MNNLVSAYLGDAVYELYVREYLIKSGIAKVKDLQKESIKFVSAASQVEKLEALINKNFLSKEELDIIKRGRNSHSHSSKSTDIITYKKSTGFESLIGYLYLNNKPRLDEIMKEVLK
jgi:ribonuclease-3 family protein